MPQKIENPKKIRCFVSFPFCIRKTAKTPKSVYFLFFMEIIVQVAKIYCSSVTCCTRLEGIEIGHNSTPKMASDANKRVPIRTHVFVVTCDAMTNHIG